MYVCIRHKNSKFIYICMCTNVRIHFLDTVLDFGQGLGFWTRKQFPTCSQENEINYK